MSSVNGRTFENLRRPRPFSRQLVFFEERVYIFSHLFDPVARLLCVRAFAFAPAKWFNSFLETALAVGNSERVNDRLQFAAVNSSHGDKSRRGMACACGRIRTDRVEVMRRHDCAAPRLRRREGGGNAGGFVQIFRPARSNVIIVPSSTRRRPRRDADEYHGEAFSSAFSARSRDVGTSLVKIFCRDIYGFSPPFNAGLKRHEAPADTYFVHLFCSRCVTALIIESFA